MPSTEQRELAQVLADSITQVTPIDLLRWGSPPAKSPQLSSPLSAMLDRKAAKRSLREM